MFILSKKQLKQLFALLKQEAFSLIGPVVKDGVISYEEVPVLEELASSVQDKQSPAFYSLKKTNKPYFFSYANGFSSLKKFFFPAQRELFSLKRDKNKRFNIFYPDKPNKKLAFFGIKPCDLAALVVQDKIFMEGDYQDIYYQNLRKNSFIVVANCTHPSENCFCTSFNTGPAVKNKESLDISLTEILEADKHYFIAEAFSERAREYFRKLKVPLAKEKDKKMFNKTIEKSARKIKKRVNEEEIKKFFPLSYENYYWREIGKRCLGCGNCTLVCPSCFCSTVLEKSNIGATEAERVKVWDSCFNVEFSYIHPAAVRKNIYSRYRQWLMHKFFNWYKQFKTSGCVGCGRCISWCPVGIDVRDEVNNIILKTQVESIVRDIEAGTVNR